ncbi:MAG: hypothetical protein OXF02_06635 [Simkaniaceae bacterium]|nr:hypothetical protein [Simkaniaceae bacterium]
MRPERVTGTVDELYWSVYGGLRDTIEYERYGVSDEGRVGFALFKGTRVSAKGRKKAVTACLESMQSLGRIIEYGVHGESVTIRFTEGTDDPDMLEPFLTKLRLLIRRSPLRRATLAKEPPVRIERATGTVDELYWSVYRGLQDTIEYERYDVSDEGRAGFALFKETRVSAKGRKEAVTACLGSMRSLGRVAEYGVCGETVTIRFVDGPDDPDMLEPFLANLRTLVRESPSRGATCTMESSTRIERVTGTVDELYRSVYGGLQDAMEYERHRISDEGCARCTAFNKAGVSAEGRKKAVTTCLGRMQSFGWITGYGVRGEIVTICFVEGMEGVLEGMDDVDMLGQLL